MSVCLQSNSKSYQSISMNFPDNMDNGTRNRQLDLRGDRDNHLDLGLFFIIALLRNIGHVGSW